MNTLLSREQAFKILSCFWCDMLEEFKFDPKHKDVVLGSCRVSCEQGLRHGTVPAILLRVVFVITLNPYANETFWIRGTLGINSWCIGPLNLILYSLNS